MATRTSLYSFQNNIIEIGISIDVIGEINGPDVPLTDLERTKFGLLDGANPWAHLGVPDFVIQKSTEDGIEDEVGEGVSKNCPASSSCNSYVEEARKRSLSNMSISTEDISREMEEFSKAWADSEDMPPEVKSIL